MSKDELVKKYIDEYFDKGFIYFSIFLAATPILFAKKLEEGI